ncbi:MAG: COX15/CtaA family protein [Saprospiraceae bacterium]|nr:COX15/CtaA family protein [Saprospiraceae bacterium]
MNLSINSVKTPVRIWLIIGVVMIIGQVILGGITRLTGSGLSITKWDIVTGTLPPLTEEAWLVQYDLYKQTPQYHKINNGMSLSDFKFIFFWEYFHRLWARSMGFVFLFPYLYFRWKKNIPTWLNRRLYVVILLALIVASIGWIMVMSGLVDRPWVNAYKLTLHLTLAAILYLYLLWTTFMSFENEVPKLDNASMKKWQNIIFGLTFLQFMLGGLMSGMKAGLIYPSWPDMNGSYFPALLFDMKEWALVNFTNYDSNIFAPTLIQFLHRGNAYLLFVLIFVYFFKFKSLSRNNIFQNSLFLLLIVLVIQVIIGILTVISCKGTIPVGLGVLHQLCGLLLLSVVLFQRFFTREKY